MPLRISKPGNGRSVFSVMQELAIHVAGIHPSATCFDDYQQIVEALVECGPGLEKMQAGTRAELERQAALRKRAKAKALRDAERRAEAIEKHELRQRRRGQPPQEPEAETETGGETPEGGADGAPSSG